MPGSGGGAYWNLSAPSGVHAGGQVVAEPRPYQTGMGAGGTRPEESHGVSHGCTHRPKTEHHVYPPLGLHPCSSRLPPRSATGFTAGGSTATGGSAAAAVRDVGGAAGRAPGAVLLVGADAFADETSGTAVLVGCSTSSTLLPPAEKCWWILRQTTDVSPARAPG